MSIFLLLHKHIFRFSLEAPQRNKSLLRNILGVCFFELCRGVSTPTHCDDMSLRRCDFATVPSIWKSQLTHFCQNKIIITITKSLWKTCLLWEINAYIYKWGLRNKPRFGNTKCRRKCGNVYKAWEIYKYKLNARKYLAFGLLKCSSFF